MAMSVNAFIVALLVTCPTLAVKKGRPWDLTLRGKEECKGGLESLKWRICKRDPKTKVQDEGMFYSLPRSSSTWNNEDCILATVPGTVFRSLLENGTFEGIDNDNIYYADNLAKVPDINATGRDFYTFWYVSTARIRLSPECGHPGSSHVRLRLRSVSYSLTVYINGEEKTDVMQPSFSQEGMFRRFEFPIPLSSNPNSRTITANFALLTRPPPHPGAAGPKGGQGGDHEIAKNAAMMQCTAGWDWIQATPDRNTGLWDEVSVVAASPSISVTDPLVTTLSIDPSTQTGIVQVSFFARNLAMELISGKIRVNLTCPNPKSREINPPISLSLSVTLKPLESGDVTSGNVTLRKIGFWYPHTMGQPTLCRGSARFEADKSTEIIPEFVAPASKWEFGVRMVSSYIDPELGGRVFQVNGNRTFIKGGNWIVTDQLLRYSTDYDRYYNEVLMHKKMGLNLIRVWGGGIAERPEFYKACNRLGVMVMQEFWMTGDNNGRWAGSYDWPLNHTIYLAAAKDTILMHRQHPSLMIWCAGNELHPSRLSPSEDIRIGLRDLVQTLDPARFFILSSMGNYTDYDTEYALAPKDGPYGYLPQEEFWKINPGLIFWNGTRADKLRIAFQPELGSVSTPTIESLVRFMPPDDLNQFPLGGNMSEANAIWNFHKYIPYNGMILNYSTPTTIEGYAYRAQLAQYQQYKLLYEGFTERMWSRYSAVIFWKSQSPWPAFRGAFYDWYLAQTGGYFGVKSASYSPQHPLRIQLNPNSRSITVINTSPMGRENLFAKIMAYELTEPGSALIPASQLTFGPFNIDPDESVRGIGSVHDTQGKVLLWRLELVQGGQILASNEYWQSSWSAPQDYRPLGILRNRDPEAELDLGFRGCCTLPSAEWKVVTVSVKNSPKGKSNASFAAFGVRLELHHNPNHKFNPTPNPNPDLNPNPNIDTRVLPSYASDG
ncbi:hypothetical protein AAMO2058_000074500 [Amorphochlora amoebiformis]